MPCSPSVTANLKSRLYFTNFLAPFPALGRRWRPRGAWGVNGPFKLLLATRCVTLNQVIHSKRLNAVMAPPPWIGGVQYNWVPGAFGGNSSTGNSEPRTNGAKKLPNKANLNNPRGINWLRRVSGMAGAPGSAKPDGSLQRGMRGGDRQRRTNPSLHNSSDQERGGPSRVEPQPGACFHSVTGLLVTGQHDYRISGATGQQNGQT